MSGLEGDLENCLFRQMLRIDYVKDSGSLDERLVKHLEKSRDISANRMQEWIRNALRNAFIQEELVLLSKQDANKWELDNSDV